MSMIVLKRGLMFFGLATAITLAPGCRCSVAETAAEKSLEAAFSKEGGAADVDIKDNSVSMGVDTKEGRVQVSWGETEAPEGLPADVPLYPGMNVMMAQAAEKKNTYTVQARTSDSLDKVAGHIEKEAAGQGWKKDESSSASGGAMKTLGYAKEGRVLRYTLMGGAGTTIITINTADE